MGSSTPKPIIEASSSRQRPFCWRPKLCEKAKLRRSGRYKDGVLLMVHTFDGNAPVEVGSFSHYFQGFIDPRWLFRISELSTVPTIGNNILVILRDVQHIHGKCIIYQNQTLEGNLFSKPTYAENPWV